MDCAKYAIIVIRKASAGLRNHLAVILKDQKRFKFVNETAINNCFTENLQILRDRWTILKDHFGSSERLKNNTDCLTLIANSDRVKYSTSEYEYRKKLPVRIQVLILKNVLEYEYRKKVRV